MKVISNENSNPDHQINNETKSNKNIKMNSIDEKLTRKINETVIQSPQVCALNKNRKNLKISSNLTTNYKYRICSDINF